MFLRHVEASVVRLAYWSFDLLPVEIAIQVTLRRRLGPAALASMNPCVTGCVVLKMCRMKRLAYETLAFDAGSHRLRFS